MRRAETFCDQCERQVYGLSFVRLATGIGEPVDLCSWDCLERYSYSMKTRSANGLITGLDSEPPRAASVAVSDKKPESLGRGDG